MAPIGAIDQRPLSSSPSSDAKHAPESNRGKHNQSIDPASDTSPAAGLKANIALARELPRALRVRGLGGQIVLDFAPLSKRDRKPVEVAIRAALRGCPVETEFVGWTPLGHGELKRKRERAPVAAVVKDI